MINLDTPDFDQALRQSRDGSFQRAAQAFLDRAHTDLRRQLQHGLSPLEFEQAQKIEAAIAKAGDVLRFSLSVH